MPVWVTPSGFTVGGVAIIAAVAYLIRAALKGGSSSKLTINYLGSAFMVFGYFAAFLPWVTWIVFEWLPRPSETPQPDNFWLKELMNYSQYAGIFEHLFILGILAWHGWKGKLELKYTGKLIVVAVLIMLGLGVVFPWVLWGVDVIPSPPSH